MKMRMEERGNVIIIFVAVTDCQSTKSSLGVDGGLDPRKSMINFYLQDQIAI